MGKKLREKLFDGHLLLAKNLIILVKKKLFTMTQFTK